MVSPALPRAGADDRCRGEINPSRMRVGVSDTSRAGHLNLSSAKQAQARAGKRKCSATAFGHSRQSAPIPEPTEFGRPRNGVRQALSLFMQSYRQRSTAKVRCLRVHAHTVGRLPWGRRILRECGWDAGRFVCLQLPISGQSGQSAAATQNPRGLIGRDSLGCCTMQPHTKSCDQQQNGASCRRRGPLITPRVAVPAAKRITPV
ncbi:hypothetical protein B0T14DRAFT_191399 [Immersiella caudata]|uniref:Uncharacterized protein n=1 Tax=Immersiella caudata TaxID=314043 RepID=A0AA39WYZ5_9PEZI|nr:hypothetical protein B0T14DRAFT_191399 [Immersiella caudata]